MLGRPVDCCHCTAAGAPGREGQRDSHCGGWRSGSVELATDEKQMILMWRNVGSQECHWLSCGSPQLGMQPVRKRVAAARRSHSQVRHNFIYNDLHSANANIESLSVLRWYTPKWSCPRVFVQMSCSTRPPRLNRVWGTGGAQRGIAGLQQCHEQQHHSALFPLV